MKALLLGYGLSNPAGDPLRLPGKNQILEVASVRMKELATANQDGVSPFMAAKHPGLDRPGLPDRRAQRTLAEWRQYSISPTRRPARSGLKINNQASGADIHHER